MKYLQLLFGCFICFPVLSQEASLPVKQQIMDQVGQDGYMGAIQTYDTRYEGIKGFPFLYDEWREGQLTYANGKTYETVPMKYNVYNDELWVKNQIQQEIVVFHNSLQEFTIDVHDDSKPILFKKARYIAGLVDFLKPEQMVQVLYEGDFMVVAVRQKILKKADYTVAYSKGQRYDEFVELGPDYYLMRNGSAKPFKPRKRSVLKVLDTHSDFIKAFINQHRLDLANTSDMTQIFELYAELTISEH